MIFLDMNDLASALFGTTRVETTARANSGETTTIYGIATDDSSNGQVPVYISNYVTKPTPTGNTDYDKNMDTTTQSVMLPTSPHVKKGDTVAITCVGANAAKHPYVSSVIGSGDRLSTEIQNVNLDEISELYKGLSKDLTDTQKNLDTFAKQTAPNTYLTKADASNTYLTKASAASTYSTKSEYNTMSATVSELQKQVLNKVDTYFGSGVPTPDNYPANIWTTDGLKNVNRGALYYDNDTGYGYRWNGSSWVIISDTAQTKAMADLEEFRTTYATQAWVEDKNYATQTWVTNQNYATQAWVNGKDYLSRSTINSKIIPIYRLYDSNSGNHIFTSNASEVNNLVRKGWSNEGAVFRALSGTY